MDALPTDLLLLVFSHIPLRPLLLVIRLVCKRWAEVAIKTLPDIRPRLLSQLLSCPVIFSKFSPRITSFHACDCSPRAVDQVIDVATRLRRLEVSDAHPRNSVTNALFLHVNQLTELRIRCFMDSGLRDDLLRNNSSTLRAFVLNEPSYFNSADQAANMSLCPTLPTLTSLDLSFSFGRSHPSVQAFLCRHLDSLTSLAVHESAVRDWVELPAAPKLRKLAVHGVSSAACLSVWLRQLTSLTSLSMDELPADYEALILCNAPLESVGLMTPEQMNVSWPKLTTIGSKSHFVHVSSPALASQLRTAYLRLSSEKLSSSFTNLEHLTVSHDSTHLLFVPPAKLRSLELGRVIKIGELETLLEHFTSLTKLSCLFDPTSEPGTVNLQRGGDGQPHFPRLENALKTAERRGVQYIHLVVTGSSFMPKIYEPSLVSACRDLMWLECLRR